MKGFKSGFSRTSAFTAGVTVCWVFIPEIYWATRVAYNGLCTVSAIKTILAVESESKGTEPTTRIRVIQFPFPVLAIIVPLFAPGGTLDAVFIKDCPGYPDK